jgi:hypothetical protein
MNVLCIKTGPDLTLLHYHGSLQYQKSRLILNKIYLVESTGFGSATSLFQTYRVYDENKNYLGLSREDNFITFEDWRDMILNVLING